VKGKCFISVEKFNYLDVHMVACDNFINKLTTYHIARPTQAKIVAGTYLAITCKPTKLESCSNPLKLRKSF